MPDLGERSGMVEFCELILSLLFQGDGNGLYFFRVLVPATNRIALGSLWGKMASEILMQNWDAATEDLSPSKETIDNNSVSSPLQSL